jgi:hypothetical protein
MNAYDLRHVEIPLIWRRNRRSFVESALVARGGGIILVLVAERGCVFGCRGVNLVLQQKRIQRSLVSDPTQPRPAMGRGFLLARRPIPS